MPRSTNRRIADQAVLGTEQNSISKITKAKRAEAVTQGVECLPSKHETLNSNPSITKNTPTMT
jgi:hypothetical protein